MVQSFTKNNIELPFGLLDGKYFTTTLEKWAELVPNLVFKGDLYKAEKQDCDWYALKAKVECEDRFGLNTCAYVYGESPAGYHAFNIILHPAGIMLFEPNQGFTFSGKMFEVFQNGYKPLKALI